MTERSPIVTLETSTPQEREGSGEGRESLYSRRDFAREYIGTAESPRATWHERRKDSRYSGHVPGAKEVEDPPVKSRTGFVPGYSGHFQGLRDATCSGSSVAVLVRQLDEQTADTDRGRRETGDGALVMNFRTFGAELDRRERYETAAERLEARGQTQDSLLAMMRTKVGERFGSLAQQVIRIRRLFEYYDSNGSGDIREQEFRAAMEVLGMQLDDLQACSLFALFDEDFSGSIDWEEFASKIIVG